MRQLLGILISWFLIINVASAANLHDLYMPAGNAPDGNPKGHVTLVEFFDYNCGYCRMMYPQIKKLIAKNQNLRVLYREYPVLSSRSMLPAQAALAAQNQGKYLVLHDALMEAMAPLDTDEIIKLARSHGLNTTLLSQDMQSPKVAKQLEDNFEAGQSLNIQGVPTFIVARTTPPSKQQPEVMVGPSIEKLQSAIQAAENGE